MPMTCRVCRHAEVGKIDRELRQGVPLRNMAARYGVSTAALSRHRRGGHQAKPSELHPKDRRPPRGYSWEPFQPGNTIQLRHGAFSPRKVEPLAGEIAERTLADAAQDGSRTAYLAEPSYRPALWAWARTEARIQLVSEWLQAHGGDLETDGEVRSAARLLNELEASATRSRSSLGLDPLSRARLGKDIAAQTVDLARLYAGQDDRKAEPA